MRYVLMMVTLGALPTAAVAQTDRAPDLSPDREIALARSAAPDQVSGTATVFVLRDGRYSIAERGSSGVSCLVSRGQPLSLEPICYDAEASRTIMPMEIARVELRLAGASAEAIDQTIDSLFAAGMLVAPERPAIAYMMSADQVLYADAETRVGSWSPHVHIYIPYATADQFGGFTSALDPAIGGVVDEGTPTANVIFKVREFVAPKRSPRR